MTKKNFTKPAEMFIAKSNHGMSDNNNENNNNENNNEMMAVTNQETKSRRVQLLIQPSLYDAIKLESTTNNISVNEMINSVLKSRFT